MPTQGQKDLGTFGNIEVLVLKEGRDAVDRLKINSLLV